MRPGLPVPRSAPGRSDGPLQRAAVGWMREMPRRRHLGRASSVELAAGPTTASAGAHQASAVAAGPGQQRAAPPATARHSRRPGPRAHPQGCLPAATARRDDQTARADDTASPHIRGQTPHSHSWRGPEVPSTQRKRSWRRPIFPRGCPLSIFGAGELYFRVRDGNGCGLSARVTRILGVCSREDVIGGAGRAGA